MKNKDLENTIFDVSVSVFNNCFATEAKEIPLRLWLTSDEFVDEQTKIRATECKAERDELKRNLPAITPSALLKHRKGKTTNEEKLISYSGFMQIDIDYKDNTHLPNWSGLINELSHVPNIAYLGKSVSGQGYWGLIPITEPHNLHLHFKAISKIMLNRFGIKLDASKGGNFTDLRIYSYTPDAYFNVNAEPFELKYKPVQSLPVASNYKSFSFDLCEKWLKRKQSFVKGNRNNYLKSLASYCCFSNINLNEAIQCSYKYIEPEYTEQRIEKIFKSVYKVIHNKK